jgi:hypothetical protein
VHVTTELHCTIETLAYPPAALFALALALAAYNALAVINAPRRQVHGARTIDTEVSGYDLVNDRLAARHRPTSATAQVQQAFTWSSEAHPLAPMIRNSRRCPSRACSRNANSARRPDSG